MEAGHLPVPTPGERVRGRRPESGYLLPVFLGIEVGVDIYLHGLATPGITFRVYPSYPMHYTLNMLVVNKTVSFGPRRSGVLTGSFSTVHALLGEVKAGNIRKDPHRSHREHRVPGKPHRQVVLLLASHRAGMTPHTPLKVYHHGVLLRHSSSSVQFPQGGWGFEGKSYIIYNGRC